MPYSSIVEFYNPFYGDPYTLPLDHTKPSLVLFDPTPERTPTAKKLAAAGFLVLSVDTSRAECLEAALDIICPEPGGAGLGWLAPAAIITEAYRPAYHPESPRSMPLPGRALVNWLNWRGLSYQKIPYLLYTREATPLASAWNDIDFSTRSRRGGVALFAAALERNSAGDKLLPIIMGLCRIIFCESCHRSMAQHERAIRTQTGLICQDCALRQKSNQQLFPAGLLAIAAAAFALGKPAQTAELSSDPWV